MTEVTSRTTKVLVSTIVAVITNVITTVVVIEVTGITRKLCTKRTKKQQYEQKTSPSRRHTDYAVTNNDTPCIQRTLVKSLPSIERTW